MGFSKCIDLPRMKEAWNVGFRKLKCDFCPVGVESDV